MNFPEPMSINKMPTFTVLTPHYGEVILLSLRQIIREHDPSSTLTLLEYLKALHSDEWDFFVQDNLICDGNLSTQDSPKLAKDSQYYAIGFKHATTDAILRTRIWASLRSQTLYRTVSGFMNYDRAIQFLYRMETPDLAESPLYRNDERALQAHVEAVSRSKFCFVVAMQQYAKFSKDEKDDVELMLRIFPSLKIVYIQEEENIIDEETGSDRTTTPTQPRSKTYYSVLIDGDCPIINGTQRQPRYKIKLPGQPVIGDGKSDNQNHSIIFARGEFLQLVDANQDNYFEEAVKSMFSYYPFCVGVFSQDLLVPGL